MSASVSVVSRAEAVSGRPNPLFPFFVQEYLRIMRSRTAKLSAAMMLYAVFVIPLLMARPPEEVVRGIGSWLGTGEVHKKLFLFIWIDGAMNKFSVIMGTVLAGGILVDERARGTLDLLAAKPVRGADYFVVKLAGAAAAMGTFYAGGVFFGLLTFPWRVAGFDASGFLALSSVHFLAAMFAITFAGTMAVHFKSKLVGMLVSVAVLFMLVGTAFLGFYWPAARGVSYVNPYFHGVALIAAIDRYTATDIALPIACLVAFNLTIAALGRRRAAIVLAGAEDEAPRERRRALGDTGRSRAATQINRENAQIALVSPFRALLREEARHALRMPHLIALALLVLVGFFDARVLPLFPESVYRFFLRVFRLGGWGDIALVNNYTGLAVVLYWVGVFDVLRVLVVPREEGYLDLLVSKPLARSSYLLARLIPALVVTTLLGVLAAASHGLFAVMFHDDIDMGAFVGANAILLGLNAALLAFACWFTMRAQDSYYALFRAFVPWFAMFLPGVVYLYRPDVFMAAPKLRDELAFPLNLLWNNALIARWGVVIALALFSLSAAIVALAGRQLSRRDIG